MLSNKPRVGDLTEYTSLSNLSIHRELKAFTSVSFSIIFFSQRIQLTIGIHTRLFMAPMACKIFETTSISFHINESQPREVQYQLTKLTYILRNSFRVLPILYKKKEVVVVDNLIYLTWYFCTLFPQAQASLSILSSEGYQYHSVGRFR